MQDRPKPDLRPYFDAAWYVATYGRGSWRIRWRPWRYYKRRGWRKRHSPRQLFDTDWYLRQYSDVRADGIEPLKHYVYHGWREGRQPHPLFDPSWYLARNRDVAAAGVEPLLHYLTQGWREGRAPHPRFDAAGYLASHPEAAAAGAEPLAHFLAAGRRTAAAEPCAGAVARAAVPSTGPRQPLAGPVSRGDVRAIAIYLPQFHRVPENDQWWGEGFSEWTNVRRGRPMFDGHHQPHVPHADIGHYDLDDESVLERQAEMARRHGIHGFCFYHYWFDGRRILEKPVARLLQSGRPDFPFCICWANENWTRTWDGSEDQVLLAQRHSPEGDERFLRDLLPMFRDPRYIHVEGRPLVAVYRPGLLHAPAATADRWRRLAEREGLPGLYLACFHSFDRTDPRSYGYDAAIQFPPLQIPTVSMADTGLSGMPPAFRGSVFDYREAMCHSLARPAEPYPLFRGVMPGWDNTARRMEQATVWTHSSPELYGRWLRGAIDQMQREQPPARQLLFINAWNEWAEGAHLEPDTLHGYRYLEETAAALLPRRAAVRSASAMRPSTPPDRHAAVWEHRRARVRLLLGGDPPAETREFLADHVAVLAGLAARGHELLLADGRPACRLGGRLHPLDSPAAVSSAWQASASDRHRPFVFVVLQHGHPEVTARCVDALERLDAAGRPLRIVVVDNGSAPDAVARSRELFAGRSAVTLICTHENTGFARGNNLGYRHAREVLGAAYVAVINNDTVIDDGAFIPRCVATFAACPYSVLGPDIVTPDGRRENPWNDHVYDAAEWGELGASFARQRAAWEAGGGAEFRRVGVRTPAADGQRHAVLQGAAYVFSPVFVAERDAIFDERTFLYGEEFLLAVECLLAGHFTLYAPTIAIRHEEGVSTAAVPERRRIALGYDAVVETSEWCRLRLERHAAAVRAAWLTSDAAEIPVLTADGRTHVLVDLLFSQPGPHGGGEYAKAVFKELLAAAAVRGDVQLWVALDPGQFIDEWVWQGCRDMAVNVIAVRSFAEITALVNAGLFTSFFAPAIVVYTGYEYMQRVGGALGFTACRTRIVAALLDVRDLELSAGWERIAAARRSAGCTRELRLSPADWRAEAERQQALAADLTDMYRGICDHPTIDSLVTISAYSAAVIRERVGTRRPIEVLFPPMKDRPQPQPPLDDDVCRDEFAVCVNAGRIEKNAVAAVAAFDRLCGDPVFAAEHPRLRLVLVGVSGLDGIGLARVSHPQRFVALPHVPAAQLEHLYREARFLIYPSFNEGFGYPPLEAMAHGTPSVVADTTAIPEVCGAAAVTCDPFAVDSVAAAIRDVLSAPPSPAALRGQLDAVAARQRADAARLVELLCRRAAAVEVPAGVKSRAA